MTEAKTLTLADFLLARFAEDERVARTAAEVHGEEWRDERGMVTSDKPRSDDDDWVWKMYAQAGYAFWDCEGASSLSTTPEASAQFARYDPARVLAECEAKRRIIDLARGEGEYATEFYRMYDAADEILRLLALPYADHPDYRSQWRP